MSGDSNSLFAERILPAAAPGRRARRIGRFEIAEHDGAILVVERRHVVAAEHQIDRGLPSGAAQALLRDEFESVAGCAGIEGFVAPGAGGKIRRAFVARGEAGLRDGGHNRYHSRNRDKRKTHHPTSTAMRCIALPPYPCGFQNPAWCGCITPFWSVARVQISK